MDLLTKAMNKLSSVLPLMSIVALVLLSFTVRYEEPSNIIRFPEERVTEGAFWYVIIPMVFGCVSKFVESTIGQHVQFNDIRILWIPVFFMYVTKHIKSETSECILLSFLIFGPFIVNFSLHVVTWCIYYIYGVSKYFTLRSIFLYMAYLVGLTIVLIMAAVSCVSVTQYQASRMGDILNVQHYIKKHVVDVRPVDREETLVTDYDCMHISTSSGNFQTIRKTQCTFPASSSINTTTILRRYQGEDIQMMCQYYIDITNIDHNYPHTLWVRGKHAVGNAERQHVVDSVEHMHGSTFLVTSSFTIYMADIEDFSIYECWGEMQRIHSKKRAASSIFALKAFFSVKQIPYVHKTVVGSVGLFMTITAMDYYIDGRTYNIQFEHRVEKTTANLFTPPYSIMCSGCSPLAGFYSTYIYCPFFSETGCFSVPYGEIKFKDDNLLQYSHVFCIHPQTIGEHKIQIKRNIPNTNSGEVEQHVYDLPLSVNLLPDGRIIYMEMDNLSHTDDTHLKHINPPPAWQVIFILFWWIRFIFEFIVMFGVIIAIYFLLCLSWTLMMKYCVLSMKTRILERAHLITKYQRSKKKAKHRKKSPMYDVLILHHEEDRNIVHNRIVIPLEKTGVRVLFPARDWAEKGNLAMYKIYSEATETSTRIIIAFSNKFRKDHLCMNTYLDNMTIARVQNGDLSYKNVCFVKLQHSVSIPRAVTQALRDVPVLHLVQKSRKKGEVETCVSKIRKWMIGTLRCNINKCVLST